MPFAQLEAKLLLATILQHYTPRLLPGYCMEPQPVLSVLRPKNGLPVILEPTPEGVTETTVAEAEA
jgi:cytochrome P450